MLNAVTTTGKKVNREMFVWLSIQALTARFLLLLSDVLTVVRTSLKNKIRLFGINRMYYLRIIGMILFIIIRRRCSFI
jgi:hypothetical protein